MYCGCSRKKTLQRRSQVDAFFNLPAILYADERHGGISNRNRIGRAHNSLEQWLLSRLDLGSTKWSFEVLKPQEKIGIGEFDPGTIILLPDVMIPSEN